MKIAIPINEKSKESGFCPSFGRAPYYLIHDTETQSAILLDNDASNSAGGAGIKAAQFLVDNEVNVLISARCGENAAKVLQDANILLYKNIEGTVQDNIVAFFNKQLNLLEDIHPGYHNHGVK